MRQGDQLVEEKREVMQNSNTSLERLIVEQLIEGPQELGHYATIPSDVKLLNVSVNDSVCSINLDAAFLKQHSGCGGIYSDLFHRGFPCGALDGEPCADPDQRIPGRCVPGPDSVEHGI